MASDGSHVARRPFREVQRFNTWCYPLVGGMLLLFCYLATTLPYPVRVVFIAVAIAFTPLAAIIVLGTLRMTTEVSDGRLRVRYGLVPFFRMEIPLDRIEGIEFVEFRLIDRALGVAVAVGERPRIEGVEAVEVRLREFRGGWAKSSSKGDVLLYAGGTHGVRLGLVGGKPLIVGSRNPSALAEAIRSWAGVLHPPGPTV